MAKRMTSAQLRAMHARKGQTLRGKTQDRGDGLRNIVNPQTRSGLIGQQSHTSEDLQIKIKGHDGLYVSKVEKPRWVEGKWNELYQIHEIPEVKHESRYEVFGSGTKSKYFPTIKEANVYADNLKKRNRGVIVYDLKKDEPVKTKVWVFGTRNKKWVLVDDSDRDYSHGISQTRMKEIGKKSAENEYLRARII